MFRARVGHGQGIHQGTSRELDMTVSIGYTGGMKRISIIIVYNGGWPRYHTVSEDFLARLEKHIALRPHLDTVITRLGEAK